jgi:broad specificity phosphatase PhoE
LRTAVLARHGESEYSVAGRLNGDLEVDVRLTPGGLEQARELGRTLAGEPLDLCATSEFRRARETADEALGGRRVPRLVLPELNDPRYGRFEGAALADYRSWASASPSSAVPGPGGESRLEIVERYARGFRTLLDRPEEAILAVCHSLPVSYALGARAGLPPGARTPLAEYAVPYPFTAEELSAATRLLEQWVARPTW